MPVCFLRSSCALLLPFALALDPAGRDAPATKSKAKPAASAPGASSTRAAQTQAQAEATGSTAREPKPAAAVEAEGPRVNFAGKGGSARFVGTPATLPPLPIKDDAAAGCDHSGAGLDHVDPSVQVSAAGGLANVVIEITVKGAPAPTPLPEVVLDQAQCRFEPHVIVMPAGSQVVYRNSDLVSHNVNVIARRNDSMNVMVEPDGTRNVSYPQEDQIQIKCDVHPWMGCWLYVSGATHSLLSDSSGAFQLPDLPAGKHSVSCWHESLGTGKGTLVVGADGTVEALEVAIGKRRR